MHAVEDAESFFAMTRENNISFAALPQQKRTKDRWMQLPDYRAAYLHYFIEIMYYFPLIYTPILLLCTYSLHCIKLLIYFC